MEIAMCMTEQFYILCIKTSVPTRTHILFVSYLRARLGLLVVELVSRGYTHYNYHQWNHCMCTII